MGIASSNWRRVENERHVERADGHLQAILCPKAEAGQLDARMAGSPNLKQSLACLLGT
jgi:hypothetical protein